MEKKAHFSCITYGSRKGGNHRLSSYSAALASRSVYPKMIYVNIGLNGLWIQRFPLSFGSFEDLCVETGGGTQPADGRGWSGLARQVDESPSFNWYPHCSYSVMHASVPSLEKLLTMNMLQSTKHISTRASHLCDVYCVQMKKTVITVYYRVISHWAPKSFVNSILFLYR